jgi:hypothetical protein
LQTPCESVEANFGQYPFEFDIHNYVKEWHIKTRQNIERFSLKKENENNLPIILRKLISTYLVHHGYSSTAEAFAKSVGHVFEEELASIRNRQRIQKSVLNGRLGEAIELTYQLFPGILENNSNLLFALKVREFIEMINSAANSDSNSASTDISNDCDRSQTTNASSNACNNGHCPSNEKSLDCINEEDLIENNKLEDGDCCYSKLTPPLKTKLNLSLNSDRITAKDNAMIVDTVESTYANKLHNGSAIISNGYASYKLYGSNSNGNDSKLSTKPNDEEMGIYIYF